jgi:PAS domain S-box-containing protein
MTVSPHSRAPRKHETPDSSQRITELERENARLDRRVTELEAALSQSQLRNQKAEMLTAILEATTDFVGAATLDGQILFHNPAWRWLIDIAPDTELTTLHIPDYHPAWALKLITEQGIPTAIEQGIWTGETAVVTHDGQEIPTSQVIICHTQPDGTPAWLSTVVRDISALKRSKEAVCTLNAELEQRVADRTSALRQSQTLLAQFLDNIPAACYTLDMQERYLMINQVGAQTIGYTPEEIVGKSTDRILPAEVAQSWHTQIEETLECRHPVTAEQCVTLPDGDHTFLTTLFPIWNDYEEMGSLGGISLEITDRKHAEAALKQHDAILTAVGAAAETFLSGVSLDDGLQMVLAQLGQATDASRTYIFANEPDEHGTLRTSQRYEWVAEGISSQLDNPYLQHLAYLEVGLERWTEYQEQGLPVYGNIRNFPSWEQNVLIPQDICSLAVIPIFVGAEWWGFIGFDECRRTRNWDVSEIDGLKAAAGIIGAAIHRERSEQALRTSEQRFRDVMDAAGEYIWEIDTQGRYTFVSRRIADVLGYPPTEVVGHTPFEFMPPNDAQHLAAWFAERAANLEPFRDVYHQSVHRDGRMITQRVSGVPVFAEGTLVGYRGAGLDVTEQVAYEAEREQMQAQLIQAQQDTLRELSTPLIPIADHVVIMPLIGAIDTSRAHQILESLLEGVAAHQAEVAILDITGVQVVDTQVAQALIRAAQAVKLLGAQIMLTGIQPQIAQTLVHLGIDLQGITTHSTLQSGITAALHAQRNPRPARQPGSAKQ